jgi:hypothetical protein
LRFVRKFVNASEKPKMKPNSPFLNPPLKKKILRKQEIADVKTRTLPVFFPAENSSSAFRVDSEFALFMTSSRVRSMPVILIKRED